MEKKETDGTYTLLHRISSGARSVVWLAREERENALRVVKEVPEEELPSKETYEQLCHLCDPAIPVYYKRFKDRYPVMEYIRGRTLWQLLEDGPFSEMQVLSVLLSLSEALSLLHAQTPPMIHGDLKPANVMLTEEGEVRLIDLDGCLQGRRTTRFGTVGYAAPEQLAGELLPASDQYGLAALGVELLTGNAPQRRRYRADLKLPCSRRLSKVLARCLAEDPKERYPDMRILTGELRRVKRGFGHFVRGRIVAAGLLLLCLAGSGAAWNSGKREAGLRELLAAAELSGDYESVILKMPGEREGYEGLLSLLLRDGTIEEEELWRLRRLHAGIEDGDGEVRHVLRAFSKKDPKAYEEFCLAAGEATLFLLSEERTSDRLEAALLWYREVPDDPEAELLLELYAVQQKTEYLDAAAGGGKLDAALIHFWEALQELSRYAMSQPPERAGWFYGELLTLCDKQLGRLLVTPGAETLNTFFEELRQEFKKKEEQYSGYRREEMKALCEKLSALSERMGER